MTAENLQAEWARLLLTSLADAGVRDVIISPGSRSTPFVLAAHAEPRLACFDLLDERSAGFFALGRGRHSERPALLLCTSGTAAANYLPAVIEAAMFPTPLLVLTADRPVELVACGANQTIDQLKLYGDYPRAFFDLGMADAAPSALRALRRTAAQAVFTSRHPVPGAVHLNARARKPLEPPTSVDAAVRQLSQQVDRFLERPIVRASAPRTRPEPEDIDELATACRDHEQGLIVCGPAPPGQALARAALAELSAATGYPIASEAASQLRFRPGAGSQGTGEDGLWVDAFDALCRSARFRARMRPRLILQLGRAPTSGGWEKYLAAHRGCAHWVVAPHGWNDPSSSATRLIFADVGDTLAALGERLAGLQRGGSSWQQDFRLAEEAAWRTVATALAEAPLSEGAIAHHVVASLPPRSLLGVGNSLPIRMIDTYARGHGIDALVWSQRGASGIDGVVSAFAGAAGTAGRPAVLVVGDVSFQHDLGGLLAVRTVTTPLVLVIVQNQGGRIFEQLPLASHPAATGAAFDHWTTPHERDFAPAAALYQLPYARVETVAEVREALLSAGGRGGPTLIEAVVPPHAAAEQNRRLWQRIDEAVHAPS